MTVFIYGISPLLHYLRKKKEVLIFLLVIFLKRTRFMFIQRDLTVVFFYYYLARATAIATARVFLNLCYKVATIAVLSRWKQR